MKKSSDELMNWAFRENDELTVFPSLHFKYLELKRMSDFNFVFTRRKRQCRIICIETRCWNSNSNHFVNLSYMYLFQGISKNLNNLDKTRLSFTLIVLVTLNESRYICISTFLDKSLHKVKKGQSVKLTLFYRYIRRIIT